MRSEKCNHTASRHRKKRKITPAKQLQAGSNPPAALYDVEVTHLPFFSSKETDGRVEKPEGFDTPLPTVVLLGAAARISKTERSLIIKTNSACCKNSPPKPCSDP